MSSAASLPRFKSQIYNVLCDFKKPFVNLLYDIFHFQTQTFHPKPKCMSHSHKCFKENLALTEL